MPEYLERLMSGKLEEEVGVVKAKVEEIEVKAADKAGELKSTAAIAIEDKKDALTEKMNGMKSTVEEAKQKDQTAAAAPSASDVKKDEPVAAGIPEETK